MNFPFILFQTYKKIKIKEICKEHKIILILKSLVKLNINQMNFQISTHGYFKTQTRRKI